MARKRKLIKFILGFLLGYMLRLVCKNKLETCQTKATHTFENLTSDSAGNLLFVGVMTAEKYLNTRAKSVFNTWGKDVPGKIVFFSSETSKSNEIPLVALPGVDDTYPPQRKSFKMLKYMYDNYIDKYEWFLRADDDVYIRTDRLQTLLRSVDSRKPWFIGQTGRGNTDEFGLLSLEENENFCMGGPGVILSKETLKRIAPNIEACLENLYTSHEDVELGRCVRKFAGVPCTWSYEMQVILYHNQSGDAAFSGDLKQKEVHRAITMHPVKYPQYMHRVDIYVKGLKIQQHQHEMIQLHRDISSSMSNIGLSPQELQNAEINEDFLLFPEPLGSKNYLGDSELLGVPVTLNRFKPKSLQEVLDWELIAKSLFSYRDLNSRRRIGSSLKEGLTDNIREIMELINVYSKQRGRIIDFKEILYGYWRLDPLHGVDLILDMSLTYKKYRGHKMTVPVRRHAYIQQTFLNAEIREVTLNQETEGVIDETKDVISQIGQSLALPLVFRQHQDLTKGKYINMIVPLSGRYDTFKRFMEVYEDVCIKQGEFTRLMIVLYKNKNLDFINSLELINRFKLKYLDSDIFLNIISNQDEFSRGRALQLGASFFRSEDLLLFIDVDVTFNYNSLQRIRFNTDRNKSIYFPIVYSLYNQKFINVSLPLDKISINNKGFWRQFGFGIVSLYKSDFTSLGGFNTSITGWGLEDVDLFENAVKSNIKIFRSIDKDLIHVFHPVECDNNLGQTQKDMCLGTKANILGSLSDLQNYYIKYKHLLFR